MKHIVFLVEEPSMKLFLEALLPKIIPETLSYVILPHEGRTDLERSIPRKLRAYRLPGYEIHFVILRDQHGADCMELKRKLRKLSEEAGRPDAIIRIVCQELESWYLGDIVALEEAYGLRNLAQCQFLKRSHDPDRLTNAADIMYKIAPDFTKLSGAKVAQYIKPERNCSKSFQVFLASIRKIVAESA